MDSKFEQRMRKKRAKRNLDFKEYDTHIERYEN